MLLLITYIITAVKKDPVYISARFINQTYENQHMVFSFGVAPKPGINSYLHDVMCGELLWDRQGIVSYDHFLLSLFWESLPLLVDC